MKRRLVFCVPLAVILMLGLPFQAQAQGWRATALDPGNTYVSTRAQAAKIPLLDRSIVVDLDRTSLEQALAQIATRTGLRLTYSTDLLPANRRISLHAPRIMAADAVLRVLEDTSLDLLVSPSGHAVLVECSPATCSPRINGSGTRERTGRGAAYAHWRRGVGSSLRAPQSVLAPRPSIQFP